MSPLDVNITLDTLILDFYIRYFPEEGVNKSPQREIGKTSVIVAKPLVGLIIVKNLLLLIYYMKLWE